MPTVEEKIPLPLEPSVAAAVAYFNSTQPIPFTVTGILDPELTLAETDEADPATHDLRLILCGGDRCEQHSFRISPTKTGFDVKLLGDVEVTTADGRTPPKLDPPPGARRSWLDRAVAQHAFVVLVFYRGFW